MTTTFWIKALQMIASLGLLVFIHELGHFMWARIFGVKVEKFYLFFDIGLKKLGITPIHRKTFEPIKSMLKES